MDKTFSAQQSVTLNVPVSRVWEALTDPALVKQWMFDTELTADWHVGGAITYRGEWEGKPYEDKGTVLEIVPNQRLKSSYFSPLSGQEDKPENYSIVTYDLVDTDGMTTLTVTQDNLADQKTADYMSGNWSQVLGSIKTLLER